MRGHDQAHGEAMKPEDLLGPLNEVEKKFAPKQVFVAGDTKLFEMGPRVSIVGSRKATVQGLHDARQITQELVRHGVVIVSGLAEGIDTAAHSTAIHSGGKTIAVLGTPLNECFPRANHALQDTIMRDHLTLSQFPAGLPVQRGNFPMRNRTMALMSNATVIVEAGEDSGSLHQGWEALRLGRPLFITQRIASDTQLTWPKKMQEYGAMVLAPEQLEDLLDLLPASGSRLRLDASF